MSESVTDPQLSAEKEIDTDLPENRLKRATNHYNFELTDLPHTFGMSFRDRFISIRSSLFRGFPNVSGEDHHRLLSEGRVLSDSRAQIHDEFMPSNEAAEVAFDGYMPLVDGWYRDIQALPEGKDKQETVYRMLSAMFIGGVLIHPARDGNGQTFKGLTVSYLHDLLPDHRDRFVPIKYDRDHHDLAHEMSISFMGGGFLAMKNDLTAGAAPEIEPKSDKDRQLVEYMTKAKEIYYRTPYVEGESYEQRDKKIEKEIVVLVEAIEKDLGIPNIAKREVVRYAEQRHHLFLRRRVPVYLPLAVSLNRGCRDYLLSQGYPAEQVQVTVFGPPGQKIDRASNAVRQLMGSETGRKVLTEYVMTGNAEIGEEDTLANELFRKTIKMLGRQKDNIVKTLETKEEHDRRHQAMMQQLS